MLALHADECVDARIVAGLRRRNVDVVTAHDLGLLGAPDDRHIAQACDVNRVVVTCDDDFLKLIRTRVENEVSFPGLIFIQPETSVGEAVRAIELIAAVLEPKDIENWIEWVP